MDRNYTIILRKKEMDMLYTVKNSLNKVWTAYASQDGYVYTKQDLVVLLNRRLKLWEETNNEPGYRERYSLANDANEIIQELHTEFNFIIEKVEETKYWSSFNKVK